MFLYPDLAILENLYIWTLSAWWQWSCNRPWLCNIWDFWLL